MDYTHGMPAQLQARPKRCQRRSTGRSYFSVLILKPKGSEMIYRQILEFLRTLKFNSNYCRKLTLKRLLHDLCLEFKNSMIRSQCTESSSIGKSCVYVIVLRSHVGLLLGRRLHTIEIAPIPQPPLLQSPLFDGLVSTIRHRACTGKAQ